MSAWAKAPATARSSMPVYADRASTEPAALANLEAADQPAERVVDDYELNAATTKA